MVEMAGEIAQILLDIKEKIPLLFEDVIDKCKVVVEHFETHLKTMISQAQDLLEQIADGSSMYEETLVRFKEDQRRALEKFKEEIEKKIRKISVKALCKIQQLNKKTQDVVTAVVDFQIEVKDRLAKVIDENKESPLNLAEAIRTQVEPLHNKYTKVKKDVDKMSKTLPKKMEQIYLDLGSDVKKLQEQSGKKLDDIVEKYRRLTS